MQVERILNIIQQDIPLQREPFDFIAESLGCSLEKVFELLKSLKQEGVIRQIAPIYDTKSIGYKSALVSFKVDETNLNKTVSILNSHPGVSHNYLRDDEFNVWFTIAVPPDSKFGLEKTIELLEEKTHTKEYIILTTKKVFKISARFVEHGEHQNDAKEVKTFEGEVSEEDKEIIRITQYDLEITKRPFDSIAQRLDIDIDRFIERLNWYKSVGIMRRFSGLLNHRKAGFLANGMSVWEIPQDKIDEYGTFMASFDAVTHCYERNTNKYWKYNLFAMIHGKTKEDVYKVVNSIKEFAKNMPHKVLFSTQEFKKTRLHYFEPAFYEWENQFS